MKYLINAFLIIFISIFYSACSPKQITIKSLNSPKYNNIPMQTLFIDEFINDNINQKTYVENILLNHFIEDKYIYEIKTNQNNVDTLINGEVLNKSIVISPYYKRKKDYNTCREHDKEGKCLRYKIYRIYCEKRTYNVETKIQIKKDKKRTVFSNIYSNNTYTDICANEIDLDDEIAIYKSLARTISNTFLKDISFYYSYKSIAFIDELEDESLYNSTTIKRFNSIIENIDKNIYTSKLHLEELNTNINKKSYEVLYNLGLIYEYENNLHKALRYYKTASEYCFNQENSTLIYAGISRIENNQKIKTNL